MLPWSDAQTKALNLTHCNHKENLRQIQTQQHSTECQHHEKQRKTEDLVQMRTPNSYMQCRILEKQDDSFWRHW